MTNSPRFCNPRTGFPFERRGDNLSTVKRMYLSKLMEFHDFALPKIIPKVLVFNGEFDRTQIDSHSKSNLSLTRFYASTGWDPSDLDFNHILEVGSGAGRFTEIVLRTKAVLQRGLFVCCKCKSSH